MPLDENDDLSAPPGKAAAAKASGIVLRRRWHTIRISLGTNNGDQGEGSIVIPQSLPFTLDFVGVTSQRAYDETIVDVTQFGTDQNSWLTRPTRLAGAFGAQAVGASPKVVGPLYIAPNEKITIKVARMFGLDPAEVYPGVLIPSIIDFVLSGWDSLKAGK